MVYFDTSVLVAYYCPEPISGQVEKKIRKIKQPAISPLTEVELVSAISRKIREKGLSREDGNRVIGRFQSHIKNRLFRWIPVEHQHFQMAKNWISQFNTPLRTLDALHLAITSMNNLSLFTADFKLAESARLFGVEASMIGNT